MVVKGKLDRDLKMVAMATKLGLFKVKYSFYEDHAALCKEVCVDEGRKLHALISTGTRHGISSKTFSSSEEDTRLMCASSARQA